jgi:PhnB protein
MAVRAIPEGYHTVTPYLVVPGVARLLDFLKQAFAATETERMAGPDGAVRHAEVQIGDSRVMMGEAQGAYPPMPAVLQLYVEDVDAAYERAVRAGGTSLEAPADQFYGDRRGGVQDPCGNQWWISTRKEDLSADELARRAKVAMEQPAPS